MKRSVRINEKYTIPMTDINTQLLEVMPHAIQTSTNVMFRIDNNININRSLE